MDPKQPDLNALFTVSIALTELIRQAERAGVTAGTIDHLTSAKDTLAREIRAAEAEARKEPA